MIVIFKMLKVFFRCVNQNVIIKYKCNYFMFKNNGNKCIKILLGKKCFIVFIDKVVKYYYLIVFFWGNFGVVFRSC